MSYSVRLLADSVSPYGVRLTTMEIVFPRFLLAELNTHRMFSRNSASSRAKKPEDIINHVVWDPFIPSMNKRVKGMGVGDALNATDAQAASKAWLFARDKAVLAAQLLIGLDCDKSRINRLLEPFMWHTAIVSATEWDNFFALRDHPQAQPEFQALASMMRASMANSSPTELSFPQWHLPLVDYNKLVDERDDGRAMDAMSADEAWEYAKHVSAGRCARVSYDTHERFEHPDVSVARAKALKSNGHWSPFEHVARPWSPQELSAAENAASQYKDDCRDLGWKFDQTYYNQFFFSGNFKGWMQMRKEVPHESNFAAVTS